MQESMYAVQKLRLVNLDSLEERETQFNPEQFTKTISVEWKRYQVAGLSYEPVLYSHTANQELSLTLPWMVDSPKQRTAFDEFHKFVEACCYATQPGGSPPDVLLVWPNVVAVPVKITSLSVVQTLFNKDGQPRRSDINLSMFWVRRMALLASDIRSMGSIQQEEA